MTRDELIEYMAKIIMVPRAWNDYENRTDQEYWEMIASELLTAMENHPEVVVGVKSKLMPTPLTPEELADVIANDEDLEK